MIYYCLHNKYDMPIYIAGIDGFETKGHYFPVIKEYNYPRNHRKKDKPLLQVLLQEQKIKVLQ